MALSDRVFLATQLPDGLQIPNDWLNLIHGMPLLSDDYYYHLFSQQERCIEFILCSISRMVMALITKWPTSLTPTIFRRRQYCKHQAWNLDGMVIDTIMWRKVLIDGVIRLKSNQNKFPVQLLRLALFTLAKASQHRFPVARFNALLHININGVLFAKTHYSSLLMTTLWSAPCLVMISQRDEILVIYLLREAHV